ncbi:hypothetical protein [Sphingobium fuliginis]|uniref:Uncharacterized protein n=1 Tax=Sphingobium fuliginis ATCC 27551 TaxID=1208342 RepID=A0A5B8CAM9_SPHSA|nr:hypothetical protein [Sphingobium fuliginis]QDC36219.1 hypothetical protein FIL70_02130 [Sphingobium fuliginis ATCC 27551]
MTRNDGGKGGAVRRVTMLVAVGGPLLVMVAYGTSNRTPAPAIGMASPAFAAEQPATGKVCPDISKLGGICNDVYSRTIDNSDPENFSYAYERKIYQASCVDFKSDTQAEARQKIQALWEKHQDRLQCNGSNFPVANGSILKFAVEMKATVFITNATKYWGINLNIVDKSDGRTVLDFTKDRMNDFKGSPSEEILQNYYNEFRRYGAKHASELQSQRRRKS